MEMEGFEPSTFCMQGRRSSQLELHPLDGVRPWSKHCHDHVPTWWPVAELTRGPSVFQADALPTELTGRGAHGGSRTPDSRIRSPELCPLKLRAQVSGTGRRIRTSDVWTRTRCVASYTIPVGHSHGRRDSNPQPTVLETDALPVELRPFDGGRTRTRTRNLGFGSRCVSDYSHSPVTAVHRTMICPAGS